MAYSRFFFYPQMSAAPKPFTPSAWSKLVLHTTKALTATSSADDVWTFVRDHCPATQVKCGRTHGLYSVNVHTHGTSVVFYPVTSHDIAAHLKAPIEPNTTVSVVSLLIGYLDKSITFTYRTPLPMAGG